MSPQFDYLIQSLPLGISGLVVGSVAGFGAGWVARAAGTQDSKENPVPVSETRNPWWRKVTGVQIVGLFVLLLAIGSTVQGYTQSVATERLALCQQAYNDGFADALEARSTANAEAQRALDDLMVVVGDVLTQAQDQKVLVEAVEEYLLKRQQARETQAANPYPEPPRDACKEQ